MEEKYGWMRICKNRGEMKREKERERKGVRGKGMKGKKKRERKGERGSEVEKKVEKKKRRKGKGRKKAV